MPSARLALLLALAAAAPAVAHPLAPALLELRAAGGGTFDVTWKVPLLRPRGAGPAPVLPARCQEVVPPRTTTDATGVRSAWRVACGSDQLAGERVGVTGLLRGGPGTVVRVVGGDGRRVQAVLSAERPALVLPADPRARDVFLDYLRLGGAHILGGFDHLLFVFGLVLLGGTPRRVLGTLTAFTLGHSVTLALAALGVVDLPTRPIEAAIAASVFALAVEVARPAGHPSLLGRHPALMATAFGLLHGLGFAAALREAGLPAGEVPLALLAFNLGVEGGQIAFVLAVVALGRLARVATLRPPRVFGRVPAYAMGSLAGFWLLERTVALWR